jgi:hypothetical protein
VDAALLERQCSGGLEDRGWVDWAGGREDGLDLKQRRPRFWPSGAADVRMSHERMESWRTGEEARQMGVRDDRQSGVGSFEKV